ncbi:MAG TPA: methionyl-tRNA formyltransferase [Gemmatimonadales bacterium]
MTRLRVVFLGTPEFAVPSLQALLAETDVRAVITQPDRPKGRGRQVAPPAVAGVAQAQQLRLLQPTRLRSPELIETLRAVAPDLNVTVAYGKIIPREVLDLPPLGSINVHPSLLPKYRGASPIAAAILSGETETGVTIMYQSMELDAGDIILQRRAPIAPDDTTRTLEARLARLGADALLEALRLIASGSAPRIPQDHRAASYAGKLEKEHGRIDWAKPPAAVVNLVRAMDPWPSAFTTHRGGLLKVWRATSADRSPSGEPGTILEVGGGSGIVVASGGGAVRLLEVQPEDRRRMSADDYARGARVTVGERLGRGADS